MTDTTAMAGEILARFDMHAPLSRDGFWHGTVDGGETIVALDCGSALDLEMWVDAGPRTRVRLNRLALLDTDDRVGAVRQALDALIERAESERGSETRP